MTAPDEPARALGLSRARLIDGDLAVGPVPTSVGRVRISLMAGESGLANYKIILYAQEDGSWVAEIPAIGGCYALMETREAALQELEQAFQMIRAEYAESGKPLPVDRTELLVHA